MSTLDKNNYAFICSNQIEDGLKTLIDNKEIISLVILEKGFATCGDCENLESCDKIKMITSDNLDVLERLRKNED